jgi:hypothetical protein
MVVMSVFLMNEILIGWIFIVRKQGASIYGAESNHWRLIINLFHRSSVDYLVSEKPRLYTLQDFLNLITMEPWRLPGATTLMKCLFTFLTRCTSTLIGYLTQRSMRGLVVF